MGSNLYHNGQEVITLIVQDPTGRKLDKFTYNIADEQSATIVLIKLISKYGARYIWDQVAKADQGYVGNDQDLFRI